MTVNISKALYNGRPIERTEYGYDVISSDEAGMNQTDDTQFALPIFTLKKQLF